MKKILSIAMTLVLVLSLASCGGDAKKEEKPAESKKAEEKAPETTKAPEKEEKAEEPVEQMVFKMADNQPADYPTTLGDLEFARIVEEKTNGRIKIEVYHSKQLGEEKDVIEQVQLGAIDFARVSLSPMTEFSPSLAVLALPYIYSGSDHMWKVLNSEIGDDFLAGLSDSGFVGLTWYDSGARSFYNSVKPIKTVDDLAGLKFRVQPAELMVDMVEALGASPTPLNYGEVYSAIQTNVIDGAENNWPSYNTSSHYEVAKYYTLDEHLRVPEIVIASKSTLDKLSPEDVEIIKVAAKESTKLQRDEWNKKVEESKKVIADNGNEVIELSDEEKAKFAERMAPVWEKHAGDYKDIIEKIQAMK